MIATSPAPVLIAAHTRRWSPRSVAMLVLAWFVLQLGCIFSPGLLDDVDSIYIEIAREMLHRHDFVTPYVNGIRFFDKPPLMYWMAAGSMRIFGEHDWAARIPLTIAVLALILSVYALGIRLFSAISPASHPDRGGLYAALAIATSIGPYLFTRFYIPDILIALWMTLGVHLFLIALERSQSKGEQLRNPVPHLRESLIVAKVGNRASNPLSYPSQRQSSLLPCLAFAAVTALNLLTKGLIGIVFPIAFVLFYLAITRQLRILPRLHLVSSTAVFLAIAAPWHILAALRTPAIALPTGLGLPAKGGWAWFYLYNEHFARFLSKRIPHDYGQTPVWLFWLLAIIWIMPWAAFLPAASRLFLPQLRHRFAATVQEHEAALSLTLWTAIVIGFFTLSARQEYYSLPALPALALLAGGVLAWSDTKPASAARRSIQRWSLYLLLPLTTLIAAVCGYFAITAPHAAPGTDISTLLEQNPEFYNLSLGHLFDLTGAAMGLFRGPLTAVALSMLAIGMVSHLIRRSGHRYGANLITAAAMIVTLLAVHSGLARFYPTLGSKALALTIDRVLQPNDLIILDGELTSGSSLVFYTHQQVHLINGRVNGLWYGSFWPDAPHIFETEDSLHHLWASPQRIFFFTYNPSARIKDLAPFGPIHTFATAGGKTILTNHP
jgi:4-amino-4-deoxy-L-arabinose transferase-like glycosyltransferase